MGKEMITAMGAAQRLEMSVAEVEALWKAGKLNGKKEFSQLYIEKESLYAYSGLAEGKQNKKGAGRKPNVMTFEATAAYLSTDLAEVKKLVEEGVLEVAEGADGVRGPKEALVKKYHKKMGGRELVAQKTEKKSVKNENDTKVEKDNDSSATMAADDTDEPKTHKPKESHQTRKASNEATKGATASKDEAKSPKDESVTSPKSTADDDSDGSGDKIRLDKEMSLDDVMKELFPGIKLMSEKMRDKALGKCKKCEVKYNAHDMKEVADVAYKMGKLAVYESMSEFKRKQPEKLAKRKAK